MAMIKCDGCKKAFDDNQNKCPHCGQPQSMGSIAPGLIGAFLIGCFLVWFVWDDGGKIDRAPPSEQAKHQKLVKSAFSSWDGSHIKLERLVKSNLKDPGSYEHIETKYADKETHLIVIMKYRAKNSFGGYVVNTVTAKCAINGKVIEVLSG
jgi:hypothetical protein